MKKIVTTAEALSSLDLLIADKKSGKADFKDELYWIIIIIIGGVHVPVNRHMIDDIPVFSVLDKALQSAAHVFKEASYEELIKLRSGLEVKRAE